MKKIIFIFILTSSLFFSSLSVFGANIDKYSYVPETEKIGIKNSPQEWREYVFIDGQWYLIIHYDDGTIGVIPVMAPPLD